MEKLLFTSAVLLVTLSVAQSGYGADVLFSNSGGSAWITAGNWTGGIAPSPTDVAQFGVNPTSGATGVGINMNGATNAGANRQDVGAVEMLSSRTANLIIGNNSTTASGTFRLRGATVNGVDHVILRN